jgi:hypothetical protein
MSEDNDQIRMGGLFGIGSTSMHQSAFWDSKPRELTASEKISKHLDENWILYALLLVVVFCALLMVAMGGALKRERDAFMAECLQDRKQYECTALYGNASGNHNAVVPVVVPVRVK